jgi:hypothetical protein
MMFIATLYYLQLKVSLTTLTLLYKSNAFFKILTKIVSTSTDRLFVISFI